MFVVAGTILLTGGLALMTQLSATTPLGILAVWMFIVGSGMGMFMQTVVIATQSSVETRDLGIATSSIMFFRSMGGAIGAAAFGALLTSRLVVELPRHLPASVANSVGKHSDRLVTSPDAVKALEPVIRHGIGIAYSTALADVFLAALPLAVVTMLISFTLREVKLKNTNGIQRAAAEAGEPVLTEGAII